MLLQWTTLANRSSSTLRRNNNNAHPWIFWVQTNLKKTLRESWSISSTFVRKTPIWWYKKGKHKIGRITIHFYLWGQLRFFWWRWQLLGWYPCPISDHYISQEHHITFKDTNHSSSIYLTRISSKYTGTLAYLHGETYRMCTTGKGIGFNNTWRFVWRRQLALVQSHPRESGSRCADLHTGYEKTPAMFINLQAQFEFLKFDDTSCLLPGEELIDLLSCLWTVCKVQSAHSL